MQVQINNKDYGKIFIGSVYDSSKRKIEHALRKYDRQLYIKWNPKKKSGLGCWEVRRKPENLTKCYGADYQGTHIYMLEYLETDIIHHVMDVDVLSYSLVDRIKASDTWTNKNWVQDWEDSNERNIIRQEKANKQELMYEIKNIHKDAHKWLQEAAIAGINPMKYLAGKK